MANDKTNKSFAAKIIESNKEIRAAFIELNKRSDPTPPKHYERIRKATQCF